MKKFLFFVNLIILLNVFVFLKILVIVVYCMLEYMEKFLYFGLYRKVHIVLHHLRKESL